MKRRDEKRLKFANGEDSEESKEGGLDREGEKSVESGDEELESESLESEVEEAGKGKTGSDRVIQHMKKQHLQTIETLYALQRRFNQHVKWSKQTVREIEREAEENLKERDKEIDALKLR